MTSDSTYITMERFLSLREKEAKEGNARPLITVLGYFDGVHTGHQSLLLEASELKEKYGAETVVWSFYSLPGKKVLTSPVLRAGWLREYGAGLVILDSFKRVRNMSPEQFVAEILKKGLNSAACVCGYNYHFGVRGEAGACELERICRNYGIDVRTAGEVRGKAEGKSVTVCSTLIRRLISEGNLEDACSLSGHHFATCGKVVHGREFGRRAGFPTINQIPVPDSVTPPDGVYATYCRIGEKYYPSVTNIGTRPTFCSGTDRNAETYIIGYSGDLYGQNIPVGYLKKLREEKKFETADGLIKEIGKNAAEAESIFGSEKDSLLLPSLGTADNQNEIQ